MFSHISLWPNVGRGLVHIWAKPSRSDAGMFWCVLLWPTVGRGLVHVWAERFRSMFRIGRTWEEALCMFDKNVLEAMMACFRMFSCGPTREEALCMFAQNGLEANLACFGMFRFGPTWEEASCMFEQNGLEAMLVRLRSGSNAGIFFFALAQRGKRPCACLIYTFWKRCWYVFACFALANVGRGFVNVW